MPDSEKCIENCNDIGVSACRNSFRIHIYVVVVVYINSVIVIWFERVEKKECACAWLFAFLNCSHAHSLHPIAYVHCCFIKSHISCRFRCVHVCVSFNAIARVYVFISIGLTTTVRWEANKHAYTFTVAAAVASNGIWLFCVVFNAYTHWGHKAQTQRYRENRKRLCMSMYLCARFVFFSYFEPCAFSPGAVWDIAIFNNNNNYNNIYDIYSCVRAVAESVNERYNPLNGIMLCVYARALYSCACTNFLELFYHYCYCCLLIIHIYTYFFLLLL